MPELTFAATRATCLPHCVAPTLALTLEVTSRDGAPVQAIALECQVRIEAQRRRYQEAERARLADLFGEPSRWAHTLRSLLWTHAAVNVPAFETSTAVDLHLPCTADLTVLAGKYFSALDPEGTVPVTLLFSGTVFYQGPDGRLLISRVPWSAETGYELPVALWRDLLQTYYPNTAWLTLRRDVFERLRAFKAERGLPTWEMAVTELLEARAEEVRR